MSGDWVDGLLACPGCGGALKSDGGGPHGVYRCRRCGPWPRLAGVPVLVPSPATWCAAFREAALASLAEVGAASQGAVALIDAFAATAPGEEARRFGDDWTQAESDGGAEAVATSPSRALAALLKAARGHGPGEWVAARAPRGALTLEVGCGAGLGSARLAKRASRLVVADVSLRAVLLARRRAVEAGGEVGGVVADAQALPFRRGRFDVLVAEHLVDLLEAPEAFFESALAVLRPGGRALVTTPEPSLGGDDDGRVEALARAAGFTVAARADGLTWVRAHGPRFAEVYAVRALQLRRRGMK